MKHASTLAFPEVEADAFDNICGALGRSHEDLEDDLDKVTCPDCLRAIAAWGQARAQEACGLAFDYGDDTEAMLARLHELSRVDLVRVEGEGNRLGMSIKGNARIFWELAESVSAALEGEGAANYVSWTVNHPTRGQFELIAQRMAGLRPAEMAAKERERADLAVAEVARLKALLDRAPGRVRCTACDGSGVVLCRRCIQASGQMDEHAHSCDPCGGTGWRPAP